MPAFVTTRSPVFQISDQLLLLFLPFFLRPDHHKIHDDENENERHEKRANAAAGHGSRRSRLSLSENYAEHIENWRAHLKHERARCNRSFASLVLWRSVCLTLEPRLVSIDEKPAARASLSLLMTGV